MNRSRPAHVRPSSKVGPDRGIGRLVRAVLRHRKGVGLLWLAIGIIGITLLSSIAGRLTSTTTFPGLPSYQAGVAIEHTYGNGGNNSPTVVVVTLPSSEKVESKAGIAALATTFETLGHVRSLRVVSYASDHDPRLVSPNGRAALGLIFGGTNAPSSAQLASRMQARAPNGVSVVATNLTDLYNAPSSGGLGILGELVIGAVGAILVLILVFGSFLAIVPIVIAAVSILTTFLALGVITLVTDVSQLVEYLVALIGLGVAIDYSLLVVNRWREERDKGESNDDAVVAAMTTAGRSVVFSGATVAIGLFSLVVLPVPFLRSMAYGGLLIPLVTIFAVVTLLPVLLGSWGPRLDRRSQRAVRRHQRRLARPNRAWVAWTRAVIRHRVVAALAAVIVLSVLLGFASGIHVGEVRLTSLARTGSAEHGFVQLQRSGFPIGVISPIEILVPNASRLSVLAARLKTIPGVDTVVEPGGASWRRDGTALVDVLPSEPTSSSSDVVTVAAVRAEVARTAPGSQVAGDGPDEADVLHAYYSRFPLIVALVALVSLLALIVAFRSLVLPLKAVLLNVLSVGATFGALVLVWQRGYVSHHLWGIPATGVTVDFVPLIVFAFLFGLSMDYEVFILSRIKEAHDAGLSTDDAIVEGLGRTGRLVTSAAVILFFAFCALSAGPSVPLKVFATGMAVGVLLDATVVRALLVPALVSLLGKSNWWWPRSRRIVRSEAAKN